MTDQEEFKKNYICSGEICRELNISRPVLLYQRRRGNLPGAIEIGNGLVYLWKRENITPVLEAWKAKVASKKIKADEVTA